jgi:hypothetical protein
MTFHTDVEFLMDILKVVLFLFFILFLISTILFSMEYKRFKVCMENKIIEPDKNCEIRSPKEMFCDSKIGNSKFINYLLCSRVKPND